MITKAAKFAPLIGLLAWLGASHCPLGAQAETALPMTLQISAAAARIPLGKTVAVTVVARRDGQPAVGQEVWAYLNGKQWGAQGITDDAGRATFLLPLPYSGAAQVQVALPPPDFHWLDKVFGQTADFTVGMHLSAQAVASNQLTLTVQPRKFAPFRDPAHLVGTPWYPWFTRYNAHINGGHSDAEAVPLLGSYASTDPDVIRQQMLWLDESGINFIEVDWSNNLTAAPHWKDHLPGVQEMVISTTALLDTLAEMRHEGLPTPQVELLLGMAPPFSMAALNEEMQFVHDALLTNPKYAGLFVTYLGKPLATVLSVLPDAALVKQGAVDPSYFTLRWEWVNVADRPGWWSWTDAYLPPTTALFQGKAESLSLAVAYSTSKGWQDPQSRGKLGGATLVQGFQEAGLRRPAFLFLQQFNEWGEQYNTELSDDFEPAALARLGRGGTGVEGGAGTGWGFYYLNLVHALVQVYHGQAPESTVLTVAAPLRGQAVDRTVSGQALTVSWQSLGKPVSGYTVALDGVIQAARVPGHSFVLSLSNVPPGPHTIRVRAIGAVTRFPLSAATDDDPTTHTFPCVVSVPFTVR